MEKCNLTQRPCRSAITEVIEANKNRASLQWTYELAKLFQVADSEHPDLSEEDWKRYFIILDVLRMDDLKSLSYISVYVNALIK